MDINNYISVVTPNFVSTHLIHLLTKILFTAKANRINSVDYLKNLMLYEEHWQKVPHEWLS